ncbi:hypothetical protein CCACVL1_10696, partial [Corchorus capsularis]
SHTEQAKPATSLCRLQVEYKKSDHKQGS